MGGKSSVVRRERSKDRVGAFRSAPAELRRRIIMVLHGVWTRYQRVLNRWVSLDHKLQQFIIEGKEIGELDFMTPLGSPSSPRGDDMKNRNSGTAIALSSPTN